MKIKILSLITATAMTVSFFAMQCMNTCAVDETETTKETIKIMPIGDSITHGYQSSGGYRKYFCYWFNQYDKYTADMVGCNSDYPETFEMFDETVTYDSDHCGYSGYAIQYMEGTETRQGILETLQEGNYLQTYDPDIIMLQIGTNDIISAYNEGITDRLENLVNYISDNTRDDTVIFVSTIPDIDVSVVYDWFWSYGDEKYQNTPEDFYEIIQGHIDTYNESIPVLVDKLKKEGKNVEFMDIHSVLDKEKHLNDGVHPNETGYMRMGLYWNARITEYLSIRDAVEDINSKEEIPYRIADMVSLSHYVLGRKDHGISEENALKYDVNEDGVLDSFDIGLLRNIIIERDTTKVESSNSTASTVVGAHSGIVDDIDYKNADIIS